MAVVSRRAVEERTRPQRVPVALVDEPYLLRHERIVERPHLRRRRHRLLPPGAVLDARAVQHFVAPVEQLVPKAEKPVRPDRQLDRVLLQVHEVREIPVVDPDEVLLPGKPHLAPRHRAHPLEGRVSPHELRDRERLKLLVLVAAHELIHLRPRPPVVRLLVEPVFRNDVRAPSLQTVLRVVHEPVLDLTERREVFVEREKPSLELQRELRRQFCRGSHKPLFVLDERRLALVHVLRVTSARPDERGRPVVQDVVRALAERLHLEVAAAVADE